MKKSFQFILYLGVILLFIPSCNNTSTYINYNSSNTDTVDEGDIFVEEVIDSDSADNLSISNVYSSYRFETIDTYETDNSGSIKFDLNYDGISEELYANGNGYEIKMFYSGNSMASYYTFSLPRVEYIDIYRRSLDSAQNYTYGFSYFWGSNRSIFFQMVYTGNKENKFVVGGFSYSQSLTPYISYHMHNSNILSNEFELLISNPQCFLKEHNEPKWEYVETINLEKMINSDCFQEHLQNVNVNSEFADIEIHSLKNDIFGKSLKLTNSHNSFYASDFNLIEIYERNALIQCPTDIYNEYNYYERNEKDYLICLKSLNSKCNEYIYLGTASEQYLFPYNFNTTGDVLPVESNELENNGWILIDIQKIK